MTSTVTDVVELFDLLESSRPSTVADIKNLISEHFYTTKEAWLVGGLFDYYVQTDSIRCVEILCGISKEPHDKFLIEKIQDGIRGPTRKQSLLFLGQLVRKQPSWLYKITLNNGLFKELIRVLKVETDVVVLVTGLLIVITLLPIIPVYLITYNNDIFDVFSRLAMWTHSNTHDMAEEQLLHLQVALYSLFHRLYAMYPCSFMCHLRTSFQPHEKSLVFHHTIRPMLETVRLHPFLITSTKEKEIYPERWKSKDYQDVIAECSKISLDIHESGVCEETSFHPRLSSAISAADQLFQTHGASSSCPGAAAGQSNIIFNLDESELNNLSNFIDEIGTAPPTPITTTSQAITLTPPNADETAMEATPENTPLQTPVKDRERLVFKLPERASSAAVHLNFGGVSGGKTHVSNLPNVPNPTPVNSVPSSPLPQLESSQPVSRRDSIVGEINFGGRRDSLLFHRLQKVMLEQQQQQSDRESKGLQINIPSQVDGDGTEPPGGPLTPLLPSTEMDELPPCQQEGPCKGGLHMPDTKTLIAFATRVKRLRFYSQCEETGRITKVKRSLSCPDVKEEAGDENVDPQRQVEPLEPPRQCYEHLFEGIIDVWGEHESCNSPHVLLDECIKKAASLHGVGSVGHASEARLKAQVELLHNQLLFERHRREAHTLRNRRLANKARRALICEEENSAFRTQIHQLEKEIASLKKEMVRHRSIAVSKETELKNQNKDAEAKLKDLKNLLDRAEIEKLDMLDKFKQLREQYGNISKEVEEKSATIFALESEIKHCKNYVSLNTELQGAYQLSQKDIIMLGELCRRQQEVLSMIEPTRFAEDTDDFKITFEEEIRFLKNALESKSSQCEAFVGYVQDLEQTLAKKDKVIEDLKKLVQDTGAEYQVQLLAMEDKYEGVKSINHRLELEILNLQHQVSVKSSTGGAIGGAGGGGPGESSHERRNGISPTDSDVTVDSAASAGGFGGLSSPERNVFIFGSPQFENSAPQETVMSDLRRVID